MNLLRKIAESGNDHEDFIQTLSGEYSHSVSACKDESAEAHVYFSPCFSLPLTGDIRIPCVNNCNMFAL